ncbi:MAG: signal peptidase I [Deltaproteobacteria bacterium]|nr:signal peptidase I [Deltaproteobacteria bacterium]MBW2070536.1 signal peptidase I [Deltaproteobacteria bacterium]
MAGTVKHRKEAVDTEPLSGTKIKKKSTAREYFEAIVIAILLALFIRTFVVQAFKIPSGSMKPTLLVGDHILVNKFIYGVKLPFTDKTLIKVRLPERGDVIVFKYPRDPSKDYIKRVIGLPGDQVQLVNNKLYLNGKPVPDPHAFYGNSPYSGSGLLRNFGPVVVPAGHLFVMGDNRNESADSRVWGFVPMSYVRGKAFLIYWSWDHDHFGVRWRRMGDIIH